MASVFDRFIVAAPFAAMTRVLAHDFIGKHLNDIFEENRQSQDEHVASFEAIAVAVADVALRFCENLNQAYRKHADELKVTAQSFYANTRGVEPKVSEFIVVHSASRAVAMQEELGMQPWEVIPGYRCYSVDGNVLLKSGIRLGVTRQSKGAPFSGKVIARFDLQRQLFDQAYVLLDGHAHESESHKRIVSNLQAKDVLIADRNFCIVGFMESIATADAFFVIRHHERLPGDLQGKLKFIGSTEAGKVYEQEMKCTAAEVSMVVRRITVALEKPTRDKETEIHILTNMPSEISALTIAAAYRHRWEEETAFNVLQMTLACEQPSIGHPMAPTFLFCMSIMAYNLRQTVFAALYAEHSEEEVNNISHLHVSKNISDYTPGMLVSITPDEWHAIIPSTTKGVGSLLKRIAKNIDLKKFKKAVRGSKLKEPFLSRNVVSKHVSTARLLWISRNTSS